MKGCLIIYWVVLQFTPDTMGVLVNSHCKKTSDWSNYHIRCPANHTIYITKHVLEDGFTKLTFPALGCSASDAVYCGVELPTNNINHKNYHILKSAVNACNGRNECTLTNKYFLEAEASLKSFVMPHYDPSYRKQLFDRALTMNVFKIMCLTENESRHFNQPAYLKVSDADCTCNITGSVTRVEILQTMSAKILIQSNDSNLLEHQNTDIGLYGIGIPVPADNLIIKIQQGSNTSLVLMKVLSKGNISISCYKNIIVRRSFSTVNTLRRAFQSEMPVGTSIFTQSKTSMFIETTTNHQVPMFEEKMESSDVAFTQGGVLSWIQTFSIIFLFVFALFIYFKKRTTGHNSVAIKIKYKQEKLMLACHPKDDKKKTSIEIHQADCMCASNNERKETASPYTPLQIVNEVDDNNQTSSNSEYLDFI